MAISSLSLLMDKPAYAQSTPTPIVPEFTLEFVPSFSNATTNFIVEENAVYIIINNQNFTSYFDTKTNSTIAIYYNVQVKEHNSNNWVELYDANRYPYYPIQWDNTSQTILPITQEQVNFAYELKALNPTNYSIGSQIDFQVQALLGNVTMIYGAKTLPTPSGFFGQPLYEPVWKTIEESNWSYTQTITIPNSTVPEFPTVILIITFLFTATLLGTVMIKRKQSIG